MAEQVNQRIEDMINELEQMRRINLFTEEEIRDISRKRKEFEYRIQRRIKEKSDYSEYISYELALIEEIMMRRKLSKTNEKKKDIDFTITRRLNKLFKQFMYRFPGDLEIYFQYIKFCVSVEFDYAVSGIIGHMIQIHGDKPKTWQLAAKWESEEQKNLQVARDFLLKGIHRHPEAQFLYLDLFKIELTLLMQAESDEEMEKQHKRAEVVWKNGVKNIKTPTFLCDLCDVAMKYDEYAEQIIDEIKKEVWSSNNCKEIWSYIANCELKGHHWEEVEGFDDYEESLPKEIRFYMGAYEEALKKFPDEKFCTQYIHGLLGCDESLCNEIQKITAVKHAWMYGNNKGLLSNDMYEFGIQMLKLDQEPIDVLSEIVETAIKITPKACYLWLEKLNICKEDDKKMLSVLHEASKVLTAEDMLKLWNFVLDNALTHDTFKLLYKRFQNCDSTVILAMKPKLLQNMYKHNGLNAARNLYEELIKTPPTQIEVHRIMIDIEKQQDNVNFKNIRKYFECSVQHHGKDNIDIWLDYMKFELSNGNAQASPGIYRRAIAMLKPNLVNKFVNKYTMSNVK